jgi:hypothetical protein
MLTKEILESIRLSNLREEIYKSQAYKRRKEYRLFLNTFRICKGNYRELIKIIDKHNTYKLHELLKTRYGKRRLSDLQTEVTRCIHNYLASVQTIIDNTRKAKQFIKDEEDLLEYQRRVNDSFKNNVSFQFVKDLRNITQHSKIPQVLTNTNASKSDDGVVIITSLMITSEYIINGKMSSASRKILEQNPKGVQIVAHIDSSFELIAKFQTWFSKTIRKNLTEDFDSLRIKEKDLKKQTIEYQLEKMHNEHNFTKDRFETVIFDLASEYYYRKINKEMNQERRLIEICNYLDYMGIENGSFINELKEIYK